MTGVQYQLVLTPQLATAGRAITPQLSLTSLTVLPRLSLAGRSLTPQLSRAGIQAVPQLSLAGLTVTPTLDPAAPNDPLSLLAAEDGTPLITETGSWIVAAG